MFAFRSRIPSVLSSGASLLLLAGSLHAAAFTWNQSGGTHDWQNAANWSPASGYPGSAGDVANFTNNITAAQTVRVVAPDVTVGIVNIGDSDSTHSFALNPTSAVSTTAEQIKLDNLGSEAQINNLRGSNSIYANVITTGANLDLTIDVASGTSLSIGDAVSPNRSPTVGRLTKTGGGTLFMGGSSTTSSSPAVRITGGTVFTIGSNPLESDSVVTLVGNTTLQNGGGRVQYMKEVRGNGFLFDGGSGILRVGTSLESHGGLSFTSGGRTRPGDITGDGGGAGGIGSGTGQIGRLHFGTPSVPSTTPTIESGHEFYFDILGADNAGSWPSLGASNIDQVNIPRVNTTILGGDVYINLISYQPTLYQRFRLFINDNQFGYLDGNGGLLFDNIYDNDPNPERGFKAELSDFVLSDGAGGGFKAVSFIYIPEPAGLALLALPMLMLRRRRH